jgi:hypothetical protein
MICASIVLSGLECRLFGEKSGLYACSMGGATSSGRKRKATLDGDVAGDIGSGAATIFVAGAWVIPEKRMRSHHDPLVTNLTTSWEDEDHSSRAGTNVKGEQPGAAWRWRTLQGDAKELYLIVFFLVLPLKGFVGFTPLGSTEKKPMLAGTIISSWLKTGCNKVLCSPCAVKRYKTRWFKVSVMEPELGPFFLKKCLLQYLNK